MKRVLVLEPNPYHSEVVPGIVKYFEMLGYVADVMLREEVKELNVFCRYKIKGKISFYDIEDIYALLKGMELKQYDFLFLTSMEHAENNQVKRFLDEIGAVPQTKFGVMGMYHTNYLIDTFKDYDMMKEGRLFCISDFQKNGYEMNSAAPIFFTDVIKPHKLQNNKRSLLVIGNSYDTYLLSEEYYRLSKREREKLEIAHIGRMQQEDRSLKGMLYRVFCAVYGCFVPKYRPCKYMKQLGRLKFDRMFEEIEKADFILVLIDTNNLDNKRYIENVTSGVRQLILGFEKPAIIDERLAQLYNISQEAYVGYEDGNLHEALKRVTNLSHEEYEGLIKELKRCRREITEYSLWNIKNAIRNIEKL